MSLITSWRGIYITCGELIPNVVHRRNDFRESIKAKCPSTILSRYDLIFRIKHILEENRSQKRPRKCQSSGLDNLAIGNRLEKLLRDFGIGTLKTKFSNFKPCNYTL